MVEYPATTTGNVCKSRAVPARKVGFGDGRHTNPFGDLGDVHRAVPTAYRRGPAAPCRGPRRDRRDLPRRCMESSQRHRRPARVGVPSRPGQHRCRLRTRPTRGTRTGGYRCRPHRRGPMAGRRTTRAVGHRRRSARARGCRPTPPARPPRTVWTMEGDAGGRPRANDTPPALTLSTLASTNRYVATCIARSAPDEDVHQGRLLACSSIHPRKGGSCVRGVLGLPGTGS